MTPRSLFNVILKILGIFLIKDLLFIIPQFIIAIIPNGSSSTSVMEIIGFLSIDLIVLSACAFLPYFLIFKTEVVVEKLKLYKGFDQETIPMNIHRSTIINISIIIIGGLLISEQIPTCLHQVYVYFQEKKLYNQKAPNPVYIYLSLVKIAIGLFLITGQRQIVNFIEKQRKK